MDSLLSVELVRDFKRTAVFRTDQEQFDRYQLMMTAVWQDRSRCTSIGEKAAPATVLPNSCVATPNYATSKISFV